MENPDIKAIRRELKGLSEKLIKRFTELGLHSRQAVKDAAERGDIRRYRGIGPLAAEEIYAWLGIPAEREATRAKQMRCPHCGEDIIVSLSRAS